MSHPSFSQAEIDAANAVAIQFRGTPLVDGALAQAEVDALLVFATVLRREKVGPLDLLLANARKGPATDGYLPNS
jgi:hypothetical protein